MAHLFTSFQSSFCHLNSLSMWMMQLQMKDDVMLQDILDYVNRLNQYFSNLLCFKLFRFAYLFVVESEFCFVCLFCSNLDII